MSGPRGTAMDIAGLRSGIAAVAPRRARDVARPGRERGKDRIEPEYRFGVAADHHAIAALEAPHAAAGADVDVMDAAGLQRLGTSDVVLVERIAAVDNDVALFHQPAQLAHG